jgi:hypothetical protein
METQTPQSSPKRDTKVRALYWIAAIAMTIAIVLDAMERIDWMSLVGRGALVAALVILATAKPEETKTKKVAIYALAAIALGLLLARLMNRA